MEVSIKPEILTSLGPLPITNSLITTYVIIAAILIIAFRGLRKLKEIPGHFQLIQEAIVETWLGLCDATGGKETRRFFPFVTTLFIFILLSNWFGLIPGISALGLNTLHEGKEIFVPLFRATTTDLNTTLALAIVSVIYIQMEGIKSLGIKLHLKKYLKNPLKNPIDTFVGFLELISEFTKVLSLSFRLFGNVFAGEVLLIVVTSLIPFLAPIPFLALEIFVGFIQAFVFAMLTLVFASMAITSHESTGGESHN
jgi:F-type H+-transporting ATPase subunit a